LWNRRKEKAVIEMLSPFMVQESDGDKRLHFHNAVMRWKCSLLTEEETLELQAWIDEDIRKRLVDVEEPWTTLQTDGVDEPTAENLYVQRYVSNLILVTVRLTEFSARLIPFHRSCKRLSAKLRELLG